MPVILRCIALPAHSISKMPDEINSHRAFCSGDVLLSHNLSSHYHRGCSVSLPCSEWERVVPLRDDHQSAEPDRRFRCCRSDASARPNSGDYVNLSRNMISDLKHQPSEIRLLGGSLISTYKVWEQHFLELRFILRSFVSPVSTAP